MTLSEQSSTGDQHAIRRYRLADSQDDFTSRPDDLGRAVQHLRAAILPDTQEQARSQILDFCHENLDALHRSSLDGHLTASAFVVDLTSKSLALIHHRKLEMWLQPGGHADGEGNLLKVAATEVEEEVGLGDLAFVLPAFDVDVHAIPERDDVPAHLHLDLRFLAFTSGTPSLDGNEETNAADWVHLDDLRMNEGDAVIGAARRAIGLATDLARIQPEPIRRR